MSDNPPPAPDTVDFHFDVLCPYAYQTSKWIRDVRRQTGITINWKFFSLEEINRVEGKKHPWERDWSYGWSLMRIGALSGAPAWTTSTAGTSSPAERFTRTAIVRTSPTSPATWSVSSGSIPVWSTRRWPTRRRTTRSRPTTIASSRTAAMACPRCSSASTACSGRC